MTAGAQRIQIRYDDDRHRYWINGAGVPSVTEVLDGTSEKPGIPWWAMRVGMAAAVAAMREIPWATLANANAPEEIVKPALLRAHPERAHFTKADRKKRNPRSLIEVWTVENKLTTNHLKEEAGLQGDELHFALEALAGGTIPNPSEFSEEVRGKLAALCQWWLEQEPTFHASERIVAHGDLGYAGRIDIVCEYPAGDVVLTDCKSSGGVYLTMADQVSAYWEAWDWMGYEPAIARAEILWLRNDGSYVLVPVIRDFAPFREALALHRARQQRLSNAMHLDVYSDVDRAKRGRWG